MLEMKDEENEEAMITESQILENIAIGRFSLEKIRKFL